MHNDKRQLFMGGKAMPTDLNYRPSKEPWMWRVLVQLSALTFWHWFAQEECTDPDMKEEYQKQIWLNARWAGICTILSGIIILILFHSLAYMIAAVIALHFLFGVMYFRSARKRAPHMYYPPTKTSGNHSSNAGKHDADYSA